MAPAESGKFSLRDLRRHQRTVEGYWYQLAGDFCGLAAPVSANVLDPGPMQIGIETGQIFDVMVEGQ